MLPRRDPILTDFANSPSLDSFGFPSVALPPVLPNPLDDRTFGTRVARSLKRVLHIVNGEHYSGAERVQDLLALGLPATGYEVAFACVKEGRFKEVRKSTNVPLYETPMRSRFDFRAIGQLCSLADEHGYELIHAHTPRSLMVGSLLAARLKLPLVYHVHSPTSRDSTRAWTNRMNALIERLSLSAVSHLITVSESLADFMRQSGVDSDLISVVPNGVPAASPRPPRSVNATTWTLGTVALFRPRKGTEVLLEALADLRLRGFDVRLKAIGGCETPEYETRLRELAGRLDLLDHVNWRGFCKDVDAELNEVDLLVLPSLFGEGMPMVVLEALAKGIPVVGTTVEGVPEVIRDGLEGRLAPPGNVPELAEAIASIVEGDLDWYSLHAAARQRHAMCYSDDVMARGVSGVYDKVLALRAIASRQHAGQ
jgi:glycosyltransferase involved in cell wall biosynthesis